VWVFGGGGEGAGQLRGGAGGDVYMGGDGHDIYILGTICGNI
jgi:hypothetical protein